MKEQARTNDKKTFAEALINLPKARTSRRNRCIIIFGSGGMKNPSDDSLGFKRFRIFVCIAYFVPPQELFQQCKDSD